ncbi:MAG TPA: glutathione S-transferase family protein [Kofleriaceae bacterium]|nr:glutathione S-transferase family protein [Kofleriaceae bacterium]
MLELYLHPLASYCWKVLLALYETELPFTPRIIDLADPAQRDELTALWPMTRFPVLRDHARGEVVAESSIIIEYLARHHPQAAYLVPDDLDVRARDRFCDLYVQEPMGRIVRDLLAPGDPTKVAADQELLRTAYRVIASWPERADFTLADCAAAPALFYASYLVPIEEPRVRAYVERLVARPSMIRVRREAEPYWHRFPGARASSRLVAGDAFV